MIWFRHIAFDWFRRHRCVIWRHFVIALWYNIFTGRHDTTTFQISSLPFTLMQPYGLSAVTASHTAGEFPLPPHVGCRLLPVCCASRKRALPVIAANYFRAYSDAFIYNELRLILMGYYIAFIWDESRGRYSPLATLYRSAAARFQDAAMVPAIVLKCFRRRFNAFLYRHWFSYWCLLY